MFGVGKTVMARSVLFCIKAMGVKIYILNICDSTSARNQPGLM